MKCVELICEIENGMPMAECGGAVLKKGDTIVVKEEVAARMLLQYRALIKKGKSIDRPYLSGGHYQIFPANGVTPQVKDMEPKEKESEEEASLKSKISDKSMAGKSKGKKKKKG